MPVIHVQTVKMSKEGKAELIRALTEAASAATKLPAQAFVITITELERDNFGVGGVQLSEMVHGRNS